jgi:hypothetical protein
VVIDGSGNTLGAISNAGLDRLAIRNGMSSTYCQGETIRADFESAANSLIARRNGPEPGVTRWHFPSSSATSIGV